MSSTIKVIAKPTTTKVIILPRYNSLVDIEAVDVSISDAGGYYDSTNVEGALAEMSVAKACNKYWSSGNVKELDVGAWEIRNTPNPTGDLVIRQRDVELKKMEAKLKRTS